MLRPGRQQSLHIFLPQVTCFEEHVGKAIVVPCQSMKSHAEIVNIQFSDCLFFICQLGGEKAHLSVVDLELLEIFACIILLIVLIIYTKSL